MLGREADLLLAWEVSKLADTELMDALNELSRRQVLETPSAARVRFIHDQIREVALAALPAERLSALHGSAAEAMSVFGQWLPDVLVSDIGMPEEDGYALIKKIRALPPENGADVPAIALTAFASAQDKKIALAAGFQRHIAKPVEPVALEAIAHLAGATVERVTSRWRQTCDVLRGR